jgi:hypothetical protein
MKLGLLKGFGKAESDKDSWGRWSAVMYRYHWMPRGVF